MKLLILTLLFTFISCEPHRNLFDVTCYDPSGKIIVDVKDSTYARFDYGITVYYDEQSIEQKVNLDCKITKKIIKKETVEVLETIENKGRQRKLAHIKHKKDDEASDDAALITAVVIMNM